MKVPPRAALRPLEKRVQQTCVPNTLFLNRNPPPPKPTTGAHTRSEQAAVKWGPVWELLAGLVENSKSVILIN